MGYLKIVRGTRYKGFEYQVSSWNDLETLEKGARSMLGMILERVHAASQVASNPVVTHSIGGLPKKQRISVKDAVTQAE